MSIEMNFEDYPEYSFYATDTNLTLGGQGGIKNFISQNVYVKVEYRYRFTTVKEDENHSLVVGINYVY